MKRKGYLIEPIAAMENLELAYYKAKKGKTAKKTVIEYGKNLRNNLKLLQNQILSGKVETGNYNYFTVYDPKKRQICAAPFGQRVLHHALMNICHPYFEKKQIEDSYASRIGKGTYAALDRARYFNRNNEWFLKLDVRKYFDSLSHDVMKHQLAAMFKDARLLKIFYDIIDSYSAVPGQGVPIGNLTSQYFANHYLSVADHFAKQDLPISGYVRYMDDMVLWHNDKKILLEAGHVFRQFMITELKLFLKPFCLNKREKGLPFLGYLLYPNQTRLGKRSKKRYIEKSKYFDDLLEQGIWSQKTYQKHLSALTAFTEHADAKAFRIHLLAKSGVNEANENWAV